MGQLLLYLLYGAISGVLLSGNSLGDFFFVKWVAVVSIYLIVRYGVDKKYTLNLLVVAGSVQSVLVIAQQFGYFRVGNEAYAVTGFFLNPGYLGGFQAVSFMAGLSLLIIEWNRRTLRPIYVATLLLIGYSVIISDSRAGLLACVVGAVVLNWVRIREFLRQKFMARLLTLVLAALLLAGLFYFYRPKSANARLLVWRVTADMIIDKPMFGFGVGQFDDNYQLYQAEFFRNNPDSGYVMVADNAGHAYNEFLQILAEQGVVGGVLAVLLIISLFRKSDKYLSSLLASLLVFSFFSYPSKVNGLLILFPIIFGVADRGSLKLKVWQKGGLCAVLTVLLSFICAEEYCFYKRMKESTLNYYKEQEQTLKFYTENFGRIKNYMDYNIFFSSLLEHISVEEEVLSSVIPTSETWCNIGDHYNRLGEYYKAEAYYKTAYYMVPTRVMPNYRLWKYYDARGESHRAVEYAKKILSQPVKVENTVTLEIKGEMLKYIKAMEQ